MKCVLSSLLAGALTLAAQTQPAAEGSPATEPAPQPPDAAPQKPASKVPS